MLSPQGFEWCRAWIVKDNGNDTFAVSYVSPSGSETVTSDESPTSGELTVEEDAVDGREQRPEMDETTEERPREKGRKENFGSEEDWDRSSEERQEVSPLLVA